MACSLALILQDFLQTVMSLFTVCYTCLHGVDLVECRVSDQSSDTVEIRTPLLGKRKMLSTSILRQYMHPPARYFDPAAELAALRGVVFTSN